MELTKTRLMPRPSSFERCVLCPGSLRLESVLPETEESEYAMKGTRLHVLAEQLIVALYKDGVEPDWSLYEDKEEKRIMQNTWATLTDNFDTQDGDEVFYEEPCTHLAEIGISHGTIDCLVVNHKTNHAAIIDFKFGNRPVTESENNWQLKCYALEVLLRFPNITNIAAMIIQPEAYEPFDYSIFTPSMMIEDDIILHINNANAPDAPLIPSEKACLYCKAKLNCPEKQRALALVPAELPAKEFIAGLPSEKVGELYKRMSQAKKISGQLCDLMESMLIAGEITADGYKVVDGKGQRIWKDEQVAASRLFEVFQDNGITDTVMTQPELKSPAQIEKIIGKGKEVRELMNSLTTNKAGSKKVVEVFEKF